MIVKQLVEYLQTMDPEAAVAFEGNGMWPITGMRFGKQEKVDRGFVVLGSSLSDDPTYHTPPMPYPVTKKPKRKTGK